MMRIFNVKARITLGLVGILVSMLLLGYFLQVIPDRYASVVERRTALSEAIAVYSTALVTTARAQRMENDFQLLAERNQDLLSLALRQNSGRLFVSTPEHAGQWLAMAGEHSTLTQMKVPIWSGKNKWGQLEMRFEPALSEEYAGLFSHSIVQIILFVGTLCFLFYYFFLGKVLRHLDPSKAIPGRVRSALDTMAEGLLILDRKEQIVLANQAFAEMIEKPADELIGYRAGELPWIDSNGKKIKPTQRPWIEALAKGEVRKDNPIKLLMADQSKRTFKTNCSPVLGENGKYAGVLVSFDDITVLEQKEIELINSKLEAEKANAAKSSFLANMSHEIRTPMNAILGFTEILKRGYIKNEQESLKYLNTIHSSGKNLLELINDILDLSKVESGRLDVEKVKVQPYKILSEVIQVMRVKAHEQDIDLALSISENLPAEIETDPVRFRQIAFNLIGNAVKFTQVGGVTVSCRLDQGETEPKLIVAIQDTGIGMDQAALQMIFDPFTQANSSVLQNFGGTGLGLAISQRFTQALGGDISVVSELGKGSTFSVSIATGSLEGVEFITPEQINQQQQLKDEILCAVRWNLPAANVLVVDDSQENRDLIKLLLHDVGLTVDEAENGQVAVEQVQTNQYDIILMDVNMPVLDGYAATGILRAKGIKAPIIALTANAMIGDEEKCLSAGYTGYFSKPIDIDKFMAMMASHLGGEEVAVDVALPEPAVPPVLEAVASPIDDTPIHSSLPVHKEKFRLLVVRFTQRLTDMLNQLERAAAIPDFIELANLAHALKGSGGSVGFAAFTEPAAELEESAQQENLPEIERLLAQLRNIAGRLVVPEAIGQPEKLQEPAVATIHQMIRQKPQVSRLADNVRMHPIINSFIKTLTDKLSLMEKALLAEDYVELANLAHWLKGSGGTVGFDVFTMPAETLENFAKSQHLKNAAKIFVQIQSLADKLVPAGASPVDSEQEESGGG